MKEHKDETYMSRKWIILVIVGFILFPFQNTSAQLYINEFMASNSGSIVDPDYNDNSDWIEIYNAGSNAINLKGYYITDNLSNAEKWSIIVDAIVPSKGYIVIWADGMDNGLHTSFNLSKDGEEIGIYDPSLNLVDGITYPEQISNISHGRNSQTLSNWGYFDTPTPGDANTTTYYTNVVSSKPEFSVLGGVFNTSFTVEIKNTMGGTVRYTLDGTPPNSSSTIYSSAIPVNATTIVRARIYKTNHIPGPICTHTYFLDANVSDTKLPIFSIVTDPDNFWDSNKGIYVQSFKPTWEIPVNIEFFENNGSDRAAFNSQAGVKVNGLYSWQLPQKMLGVYFRKQYGEGNLEYPLFFNNSRKKYGNFALRASGSDWGYSLLKDGTLQSATQYNMENEIQSYRPTVVYVNGQYMGIHNIREKVDDDYIEQNHSLESNTYDLIENEHFAEAGNLTSYRQFETLLNKDLSNQSNFDAVAQVMDISNFTDYMITEIFVRNTSLSHNTMAWKPRNSGQWKWIFMDLDRGFGSPQQNLIDFFLNISQVPLKELFKNEAYKQYFGKRMADHLYTTLHPLKIGYDLDESRANIAYEMPRHIKRWEGTTSSYGNAIPSLSFWENRFPNYKQYARDRQRNLLNNLRNYGFTGIEQLKLQTYPNEIGQIRINGLKVPNSPWGGPYLKDEDIVVKAEEQVGYNFLGWADPIISQTINKNSSWKYFDNVTSSIPTWFESDFNDSGWSRANGEFGYGDGNENTIISYGGNTDSKNITTYFRKNFTLSSDNINESDFYINMLCDDGAIVYINGHEVIRFNIKQGEFDYLTSANAEIGFEAEQEYISYSFDNSYLLAGNNVIAVEIHQQSETSDDVSFDLEMIRTSIDKSNLLTTNTNYEFNLSHATSLVAVYEPTGECILPSKISGDYVITKQCSPAIVAQDITVAEGASLTIEPGVELRMSENTNITINGSLVAEGNASEPIIFTINPSTPSSQWGGLIFSNSADTSYLSYTIIEKASEGPIPINQMAAVSAFNANLKMDHITIEDVYSNPITARYSDITLTNSSLYSKVTGDLINVKYGKAKIENCTFRGNNEIDTDAIDYDDVENGIVRNCKIYNFKGFNNDAIDIGEKSSGIIIDSLLVYNIVDKGVSFGQQSTGTVKHSTFVNCDMGLGLKDSCMVTIDHCIFYNVATPVACYEKNLGSAGGNGIVTNSILSNSAKRAYSFDDKSTLSISYSIADTDTLPENSNNIWGTPNFSDPTFFNFTLGSNSLANGASNGNGALLNMGSYFHGFTGEPSILINKINYNPSKSTDVVEFFSIYNPSSSPIDLSGYQIQKAVAYTFPQGVMINAGEEIYMIEQAGFPKQANIMGRCFDWTTGKLADEGETIRIVDNTGIIVDHVSYKNNELWHANALLQGEILSLRNIYLDNHIPENWESLPVDQILDINTPNSFNGYSIYPNPSSGIVYISSSTANNSIVEVFSSTGILLQQHYTKGNSTISIDLSNYNNKLLLIRIDNQTHKIFIKN